MSRIGKLRIPVPDGVDVKIGGQDISVKGKLGQLSMTIHPNISVVQEDGELAVNRASDKKEDRALHGLTRALVANMVQGVSAGFTKVMSVQGVGYRAEVKGNKLVLSVGYSQPVEFTIPDGITMEADKKFNITITGIDKQQVGQVAADVRSIRPPDAYKGKGIRYQDEKVRLKEGKSGV